MGLIKKVPKTTAMNPVARAVAKEKLKQEVLTNRIALFMMDEGVDCRDSIVVLSLPIYAIMVCLEDDKEDTVDSRKMKSACAVLSQIAQTGFIWKKEHAVTLDNALEICLRRWAGIPSAKLNRVINELSKA
jgi:hypothetical protein